LTIRQGGLSANAILPGSVSEMNLGVLSEGYRKDIDGLRGLAVLAVLIYHLAPSGLRAGYLGVDIFFVISGYLISGIIIRDLYTNKFSFVNFYLSRIRRIFPSLLTILLFVIFVSCIILYPLELKSISKHIIFSALNLSNIIFWSESGYFDIDAKFKPLLHLWSLGVEEQFYLLFPLLLFILYKIFYNTFKKIIIISIIIFLISLSLYIYYGESSSGFYLPFSRLWELMGGVVLCLFCKTNTNITLLQKHKTIHNYCSFISFIVIIIFILLNPEKNKHTHLYNVVIVLATMTLIWSGKNSFLNKKIFSNKPIRFLGLISYPLYLWHWPLISFYYIGYHGSRLTTIYRLSLIILSIILSYITYNYIEKPIRFNKNCRIIKHIGIISTMFIIIIISYYIYSNNGLPNRQIALNDLQQNFEYLAYSEPKKHDDICYQYIASKNFDVLANILYNIKSSFYCRYTDAGGDTTIAIVGDSHALHAFEGLSRLNARKGINTIEFSRPGTLRPILGLEDHMPPEYREEWIESTNLIYNFINNDPTITKVFIISRNIGYITGDLLAGGSFTDYMITEEQFKSSLQSTIDTLTLHNKKVYILTEIPELKQSFMFYKKRPFFDNIEFIPPKKKSVIQRQQIALDLLYQLQNVTIINSIDIFCPDEFCKLYSKEGIPLYMDDNHASIAGSYFLADSIASLGLMP
jgi:peptidoglycan/LPS O-acetylase OafA/YrhL